MNYFPIILAGFLGGAVRGLVGFIKHQFSYKKVGFDLKYFLGTTFISGIIGTMSAIAAKEANVSFSGSSMLSPGLAFIVGYAGGDFLENIYKIIAKKAEI